MESQQRCDVFGYGRGRARGGAAWDPEHCDISAAGSRRLRVRSVRDGCRAGGESRARTRHAKIHAAEHQRPVRFTQGFPRYRPGQTQPRDGCQRTNGSTAQVPTTGSRKGRTTPNLHDRSDYQAVRDGYISLTPLQPDMTVVRGPEIRRGPAFRPARLTFADAGLKPREENLVNSQRVSLDQPPTPKQCLGVRAR